MRTYRAQKAALTRAKNSGDPTKVTAEVDRFAREYRDEYKPLPDDWHRWNIAFNDAAYQLRREGEFVPSNPFDY